MFGKVIPFSSLSYVLWKLILKGRNLYYGFILSNKSNLYWKKIKCYILWYIIISMIREIWHYIILISHYIIRYFSSSIQEEKLVYKNIRLNKCLQIKVTMKSLQNTSFLLLLFIVNIWWHEQQITLFVPNQLDYDYFR